MRPHVPIVFIGPMAAGKSTLAARTAAHFRLRHVPLDAVRFYYYLRQGFEFAVQIAQPDFEAVTRYWKQYDLGAVEGTLTEFGDGVIDFGAGHAHFTERADVARLEALLAPLPNVFLLMPSEDLDRAEVLCNERDKLRLGEKYDASRAAMSRTFVRSESFRRVAKHTVITGDRSEDDAFADLLAKVT